MRRLLGILALVAATAAVAVAGTGAGSTDDGAYRVRAIFDNAFSLIPGEDVKIAGVRVGQIEDLSVTDDRRAAAVLRIEAPGFQDFRRDARCTIRPQGLIGERFVECTPTEPRAADAPLPPPLPVIGSGPGKGQRLLPVTNTSRPVDVDLLNNVMRLPQRQRLAVILNELGTGLAGRGPEIREIVRRANPALHETNRVLELLARQNRVLAALAEDSDRVLAPLARERGRVTGFVEQSGAVARATAERRANFERTWRDLPRFLAELEPTMQRLGGMADEMTPALSDLRAGAPGINRMFEEIGPFAKASIAPTRSLGDTLDVGRPALLRAKPIIDETGRMAREVRPVARDLAALARSLDSTGAIERLMDVIFFQVAATNGFDEFGHYLRAGLIANICTTYSVTQIESCRATFTSPGASAASSVRRSPALVRQERLLRGEKPQDVLPQDRPATAGERSGDRPTGATTAGDPSPADERSSAVEGLADYLLGDG